MGWHGDLVVPPSGFLDAPMVSCVMPTRGRSRFAMQALGAFLEQTYPSRELVILDDAECRSFDIAPDHPMVRYRLWEKSATLGAKRNAINAMAHGRFICHWDDDDIYSADRLTDEVLGLLQNDTPVFGYDSMHFVSDSGLWWKFHGIKGKPLGTSLIYYREFWESRPFPKRKQGFGSDTVWMHPPGFRATTKDAGFRIIARNHGANLNDRNDEFLSKHPDQWERVECPLADTVTA